jgi:hypothetical protein
MKNVFPMRQGERPLDRDFSRRTIVVNALTSGA